MQGNEQEGSPPTENDLERVRADLGVLSRAVGLEPPFGREDVWASLAVGAGGTVAVVWALLPTGLPAQWGIVPLIVVVVGYAIKMRTRYRRSSGRSPTRRREYTSTIVGMVVVGGLALVYRNWAEELQVSTTIAGSAALFVFGTALLVMVLQDRNRFPDLGLAVPLILCGLVMPFCSVSLWVLLGATFAVGGVATAALMAHYLRGIGAGRATD